MFLLHHLTSDLCQTFEMQEKYIKNGDIYLQFQLQL